MEFSKELLQRVSELQLSTKQTVSSLLSGNYRSAFRGSGMQFKEFRSYEPGDDIRHMSWPVTARRGRATIKVYEEERELDVILAVDVSGSSLFGSQKKRKIDMYAELVALLGLAAIKSRDNVGVLLFDEAPGEYLPPRNTRNQVLRAITKVLGTPLKNKKSNLCPPLSHLRQTLKHRSLILLISDFIAPPFEAELRMLSKVHEVVLIHCYDDAERGSMAKGIMEMRDPETGELFLLDTYSKKVRNELAAYHTQLQNEMEAIASNTQSDYLCLSVQDDYLQRLVQFFRRRGPSRL